MKAKEQMYRLVDIAIIIFGLFIAYQLLLKITGHSWIAGTILLTVVLYHLGITWKILRIAEDAKSIATETRAVVNQIDSKLERQLGWHEGSR